MTIETPGGSPRDSTVVRGPATRSPFARPMVLAGVGGACVLGLAVGLLARPQLAPDTRTPGSMKPVEQMQIEIDRDEPLPAVQGGKLELLPAGLKVPRVTTPAPEAEIVPVKAAAPVRATPRGPSFDCSEGRGAAEELICGDEQLAAQDRRLSGAWRRALDSGVPAWRLRRQQQRWLEAREDAARDTPEMVSDLYDQRIQELEDVAEMEGR